MEIDFPEAPARFVKDSLPYTFREVVHANLGVGRTLITHLDLLLHGLTDQEQRQRAAFEYERAQTRYASPYRLERYPSLGYSLETKALSPEEHVRKRIELEVLWAEQLQDSNLVEVNGEPMRVGIWTASRYKIKEDLKRRYPAELLAGLLPLGPHGAPAPYRIANSTTGQVVNLLLSPLEGAKLELLMVTGYLDRDIVARSAFAVEKGNKRTERALFAEITSINQKCRVAGLVIPDTEDQNLITTANTSIGVSLAGERFARDNYISRQIDLARSEGRLQISASGFVGANYWEIIAPETFTDSEGEPVVSLYSHKGTTANVLRIVPSIQAPTEVVILEAGKYLTELCTIFLEAGVHALPYHEVLTGLQQRVGAGVKGVPGHMRDVFANLVGNLAQKGVKIVAETGIADKTQQLVLPILEGGRDLQTVAVGVLGTTLWEVFSRAAEQVSVLRLSYVDGDGPREVVLEFSPSLGKLLAYCAENQLAVIPLDLALEVVNTRSKEIDAGKLIQQLKLLVYKMKEAGVKISSQMEVIRERKGTEVVLPIPRTAIPLEKDPDDSKFLARLTQLRTLANHFRGRASAVHFEAAITELVNSYADLEFARKTAYWTIKAWRTNDAAKFRQEIVSNLLGKLGN